MYDMYSFTYVHAFTITRMRFRKRINLVAIPSRSRLLPAYALIQPCTPQRIPDTRVGAGVRYCNTSINYELITVHSSNSHIQYRTAMLIMDKGRAQLSVYNIQAHHIHAYVSHILYNNHQPSVRVSADVAPYNTHCY